MLSVIKKDRDILAENMRQYVSGQISNFDFIERTDELVNSKDKAVRKILSWFWYFYDDIRGHKNEGKFALRECEKGQVLRAIVFLKSSLDYNWKDFKYEQVPFLRTFIHVVTLGEFPKKWDRKIMKSGDYEVWPFFRVSDFTAELSQPKYLS